MVVHVQSGPDVVLVIPVIDTTSRLEIILPVVLALHGRRGQTVTSGMPHVFHVQHGPDVVLVIPVIAITMYLQIHLLVALVLHGHRGQAITPGIPHVIPPSTAFAHHLTTTVTQALWERLLHTQINGNGGVTAHMEDQTYCVRK